MIQRVQSIYLLCASIFAVVLLFIPFWRIHLILYAGVVILSTICILNIFLYKKRVLQMSLGRSSIVLAILLLLGSIYLGMSPPYENYFPDIFMNKWMDILCLFAVIICIILANRNINKDEQLIRSMDRLR